MALNKLQLKNGINDLLEDMTQRDQDSTQEYAQRLSDLIDDYVKGAIINYTGGLIAPSGGGPVTGVLNATLE